MSWRLNQAQSRLPSSEKGRVRAPICASHGVTKAVGFAQSEARESLWWGHKRKKRHEQQTRGHVPATPHLTGGDVAAFTFPRQTSLISQTYRSWLNEEAAPRTESIEGPSGTEKEQALEKGIREGG